MSSTSPLGDRLRTWPSAVPMSSEPSPRSSTVLASPSTRTSVVAAVATSTRITRFGAAPDGSSTARPALGARGMEWRRLPPPQDWADRNSLAPAPADIRGQLFSNNILEPGTGDGAEDRIALFRRFLNWLQMQPGGYAGRAPARP